MLSALVVLAHLLVFARPAAAADLAQAPSPKFYGTWEFEDCVGRNGQHMPAPKRSTEPQTLKLNAASFEVNTREDYNARMGMTIRTRVADTQVYSVDSPGDRVILVTVYKQSGGPSDPAKSTASKDAPPSKGMVSSSIRDYQLTKDGKLIERRRGTSYDLRRQSSGGFELKDEVYDSACTYHRQSGK